jgi:hypothetical protein
MPKKIDKTKKFSKKTPVAFNLAPSDTEFISKKFKQFLELQTAPKGAKKPKIKKPKVKVEKDEDLFEVEEKTVTNRKQKTKSYFKKKKEKKSIKKLENKLKKMNKKYDSEEEEKEDKVNFGEQVLEPPKLNNESMKKLKTKIEKKRSMKEEIKDFQTDVLKKKAIENYKKAKKEKKENFNGGFHL